MKITIAGGGNIGTQFAVHFAEKGHEVIMFTSNPGIFSGSLSIIDKEGNTIHEGKISLATNNPEKAFRGSDAIIITMPPTMMIPLSEMIYENTDESTIIGFVPGNGGFELAFRKCIERGNIFFGIDRVPAIARLTKRGREVCCSGYKDELYIGAIPSSHTDKCAALIESIFDIPCVRLPGFMALTLTPSNPILHTARLKTIFNEYRPGVTYDSLQLFYKDWDDASSELLMACDDEIHTVLAFEQGADDYIAKPFRIRELLARIKAILRRSGAEQTRNEVVNVGGNQVDIMSGKVFRNGEEIFLSAVEYRLLLTFIKSRGQLLTRQQILTAMWDSAGDFVNDNTLTVYVRRLRKKLEEPGDKPVIETVRGVGYRME